VPKSLVYGFLWVLLRKDCEISSGGACKFSDQFLEVAGLKLKYADCSTGKNIH